MIGNGDFLSPRVLRSGVRHRAFLMVNCERAAIPCAGTVAEQLPGEAR